MPKSSSVSELPADYEQWLAAIKRRVSQVQTRAAVAANRELVLLYWELGRDILARQAREGWGAKVVDRLAHDLRKAFPYMKGLSRANLMNVRSFAEAWPGLEIVQQLVGQLPWGHNLLLLQKLSVSSEREWYARAAIAHGWSRAVLAHQIAGRLIARQGAAVTNFDVTLPPDKSELAQQLLKDPQVFDFLNLGSEFRERELEDALVSQIQRLRRQGSVLLGRSR